MYYIYVCVCGVCINILILHTCMQILWSKTNRWQNEGTEVMDCAYCWNEAPAFDSTGDTGRENTTGLGQAGGNN